MGDEEGWGKSCEEAELKYQGARFSRKRNMSADFPDWERRTASGGGGMRRREGSRFA